VKGIPADLEDAARIDGAGTVKTFTAVVFPLLRPAISALVAILAIAIWNDFFTPFFFLDSGANNTLTLSVYAVYSSSLHQTNWNLVFASVVLTGLPMLVVFFFAQRSIINAYLSGAVRG
jgi:raffinose/stachyose/melibiose transport system permease protein